MFIGEALSARVSYYELAIDDGERSKVKSSGLCICTGTGSTSWTFNINKLKHQAVGDLLKLLKEESNLPVDYRDQSLIDRITRKFNSDLIFGPGQQHNFYRRISIDPFANFQNWNLLSPSLPLEPDISSEADRLWSKPT